MSRLISLFIAVFVALGFIAFAPPNVRADGPVQGAATAVGPIVITAVGPVQPLPPVPAPYPYRLVLTLNDNGSAFSIPVGALIDLQLPQSPYSQLMYDPTILQPTGIEPYPLPYPQPYPPPMEDNSSITPMPPVAEPPIGIYPRGYWQLVAVRYGTTSLTLVNRPCPPDIVCPRMPIRQFSVTITVSGIMNPLPPPYPTPYPPQPPVLPGADVYIGTSYLDQTVQVQSGQIVSVDLPFLSPQEAVTLNFDGNILQPIDGQNLSYPQVGGWRFRVVRSGSTVFTVKSVRCLYTDNSGDTCPPSLLFRVTIVSGQ